MLTQYYWRWFERTLVERKDNPTIEFVLYITDIFEKKFSLGLRRQGQLSCSSKFQIEPTGLYRHILRRPGSRLSLFDIGILVLATEFEMLNTQKRCTHVQHWDRLPCYQESLFMGSPVFWKRVYIFIFIIILCNNFVLFEHHLCLIETKKCRVTYRMIHLIIIYFLLVFWRYLRVFKCILTYYYILL